MADWSNKKVIETVSTIVAKKFAAKMTLKNTTYNISDNSGLKLIIDKLLSCKNPFIGIDGKPCFINLDPKSIFK